MTTTSRSKINCAENDPGSVAYIKDATPKQRVRFDLAAQVKTLGADSLLPPTKTKPLTARQYEEFEDLVDRVSSHNGGERVIGRLQMRRFVERHGEDRCNLAFEKLTGKKRTKR